MKHALARPDQKLIISSPPNSGSHSYSRHKIETLQNLPPEMLSILEELKQLHPKLGREGCKRYLRKTERDQQIRQGFLLFLLKYL
jgi:hypothetical protein